MYVIKQIQRTIELHDVLSPSPLCPDTFIALSLDIKEFFPSAHRQVHFDMLAGCASQDYPHTLLKKAMPCPLIPPFVSCFL